MLPLSIRAVVLLLAVAILPAAAARGGDRSALREILETGQPPVTDIDAALGAAALAAVKQVYAARDARPIWSDADGRALLDRLAQPDMTIGPKLQPLLADAKKRLDGSDPAARAGADLLLTALYGATAKVLRPDAPAGFAAALAELDATADLAALLRAPEAAGDETLAPAAAPPESPAVARLRAAIAALQPQAEQGWPRVPDGPKLQLGDSGPRVEALSRRLLASGDLKSSTPGAQFDLLLQSALEHFQARHGLPPDGIAGAMTLAALNVPLENRLASLTANLQRLEGEGRNWGDRYLAVNIPAAAYRRVENGRVVAEGPAILGRPATPTPRLDGMIDRVLLHPAWRIPRSYADRFLWPRQEQDATYFYSHGIRVSDDGLRQLPGSGNPLGPAKLLIGGSDRIALHGAGRDAFESPERFTGLGCIALSDIVSIAKDLLATDPAWPQGRIDGAFAAGGTATVTLAAPLPLHVVYQTAWVDEDGTLEFRDDVYGWDRQMPAADPNPVADPCGS
jgi:murein L,D-transpeptidase YcbB/YkuD